MYVCARCQRTTHDLPVDWEVMDSEGAVVVCAGCLTLREENDIVHEDMEFIDQMKREGRWEVD